MTGKPLLRRLSRNPTTLSLSATRWVLLDRVSKLKAMAVTLLPRVVFDTKGMNNKPANMHLKENETVSKNLNGFVECVLLKKDPGIDKH